MNQLEEQLSKFFPDQIVEELTEEHRYSIVWWKIPNNREMLAVFDKLEHRVVYKANSKSRKTNYDYLKHFYGEKNCDPPKEVDPNLYEGF